MARYIDADKMMDGYGTTFPYDLEYCDDRDLMEWVNNQPTEDVAPKSEVAREIFEEILDVLRIVKIPCINAEGCITPMRASYWAIDPNDFNELKKKYTEGKE